MTENKPEYAATHEVAPIPEDAFTRLTETKRPTTSLRSIVRHLDHAVEDVASLPSEQWPAWTLYFIECLEEEAGSPAAQHLLLANLIAELEDRLGNLKIGERCRHGNL